MNPTQGEAKCLQHPQRGTQNLYRIMSAAKKVIKVQSQTLGGSLSLPPQHRIDRQGEMDADVIPTTIEMRKNPQSTQFFYPMLRKIFVFAFNKVRGEQLLLCPEHFGGPVFFVD